MLHEKLKDTLLQIFQSQYQLAINPESISFQQTRPEFEGDLTLVVFPFTKQTGKNPVQLATEIGEQMLHQLAEVSAFNVVKGFLNLVISDTYWLDFFATNHLKADFGRVKAADTAPLVIEYSSPNTNKPLHLGHIRNNLLGWSVSEILKAAGQQVVRVNLVNDRGIHICKSMLAWQKWGEGRTPSADLKGDKLVGEMYVRFDQELKKEVAALVADDVSADEAAKKAPLMLEAQQMLRDWEAGKPEVKELWTKMNGWVYAGFDVTYERLGVAFEKIYHESETFLLGKALVLEGLEKGVLYRKEDGSVWCDLTTEGLDEKLLLRADGTSVYMTQDLGTAQLRADEFHPQRLIYVVGNEQNYHFDVLKRVLKKLGRDWADSIEHLSYGMVELPEGKMKSREGTVVDADDLMDEMVNTAKTTSEDLGKADGLSAEEANQLYSMIGLGALKYFMLRVDPKKTMLFNPSESIDFNGNTGPFIQYTHARIRSVLRKAVEQGLSWQSAEITIEQLLPKEKNLIVIIHSWPEVLQQAAEGRSPALVANYLYELAKEFNQFYQEFSILKEEDQQRKLFRLQLSEMTADLLTNAASLLGIGMPQKM